MQGLSDGCILDLVVGDRAVSECMEEAAALADLGRPKRFACYMVLLVSGECSRFYLLQSCRLHLKIARALFVRACVCVSHALLLHTN